MLAYIKNKIKQEDEVITKERDLITEEIINKETLDDEILEEYLKGKLNYLAEKYDLKKAKLILQGTYYKAIKVNVTEEIKEILVAIYNDVEDKYGRKKAELIREKVPISLAMHAIKEPKFMLKVVYDCVKECLKSEYSTEEDCKKAAQNIVLPNKNGYLIKATQKIAQAKQPAYNFLEESGEIAKATAILLKVNYSTQVEHVPILCFVVNYGFYKTCKYLIEEVEVNINAHDCKKWTALHYAIHQDQVEITKLLLKNNKVNVNIQNGDGYTPLHILTLKSDIENLRLLLKRPGVHLNIKTNNEYTALLIAAQHCCVKDSSLEIIKLLIDSGANVKIKNKEGEKALDIIKKDLLEEQEKCYESKNDIEVYEDAIVLLKNKEESTKFYRLLKFCDAFNDQARKVTLKFYDKTFLICTVACFIALGLFIYGYLENYTAKPVPTATALFILCYALVLLTCCDFNQQTSTQMQYANAQEAENPGSQLPLK